MAFTVPDSTLVVIPVCNANGLLSTVAEPLVESGFDVLVVDDGSTDDTASWAERVGLPVIRHPKKRGVGAAYKSAIQYAINSEYEWIVTIDGDGQYAPADVARIARVLTQAGFVTGNRFGAHLDEMPSAKIAVHLMGSLLFRAVTGRHCLDAASGLRGFRVEPALLEYGFDSYGFLFEQVIHQLNRGPIRYIDIPSTYPPNRPPVTRVRTMGDLLKTMKLGAVVTAKYRSHLTEVAQRAYEAEDFTLTFTVGHFACRVHPTAAGYLVDCDRVWAREAVALIESGADLESSLLKLTTSGKRP
jgi:glycosyltransferase involved in cell wall biosynthesis